MRVLAGGARSWPLTAAALVLVALALLTLPVLAGVRAEAVTVVGAAIVLVTYFREQALRWRSLLGLLLLVILFIPIRRYVLPGNLPFQLEPYRILIALLVALWIASMLIDRRVKLRRTGLEGPLLLFAAAVFTSIVLNLPHIKSSAVNSNVLKSLTFLLSFILLTYLIASVVRPGRDVDLLLEILVVGGAVLSVLAVIESRTHFNVFDHLGSVFPFLKWNQGAAPAVQSFGKFRAIGPAEHPIALSAALALLVPFAGYLAYARRRRVWWLMAGLLVIGCLATVSRTGVVMLAAEAITLAALRPAQMKKVWPALLPLLAAVHFVLPGTLGTLKEAFFPQGGLIQQQQGYMGTGRFGPARLDPTFAQIHAEPVFGVGFGTRITGATNPESNAMTLDDQWLDTVLETGLVGVAAWIWLLVRLVRRLAAHARRDRTNRGWLLAALASAVVAFGVSMLTYDTFSFVQVTLFFYILIALASVVAPVRQERRVRSLLPARLSAPWAAGALGLGLVLMAVALVLFVFFQGPSIRFLVLVLSILTVGLVSVDRSLDPQWRPKIR